MLGIAYIIWGIIIIYVAIARGLPHLLSWLCSNHLKTYVKIRHIGILSLSLKDIVICKNGMEIAIDSVGISSCLFNRTLSKLLVIYVSDVRIQKDKNEQLDGGPSFADSTSVEQSSEESSARSKDGIPHSLISLSQVVSIHVYNVSVMLLHLLPPCLLHSTVQEVRLEGTTEHTLSQLSLHLKNASCKLLHHVVQGKEQTQPCLAEIGFTQECTVTFDAKNRICLKALTLEIIPEITLSDGALHAFRKVQEISMARKKSVIRLPKAEPEFGTAMIKYQHLIPETVLIEVNHAKLKILHGPSQKALTCDLRHLGVHAAVFKPVDNVADAADWLHLSSSRASLLLNDLVVTSGPVKVATLNQTTLNATADSDILDLKAAVSSLNCTYDTEANYWLGVLPIKRRPRSVIVGSENMELTSKPSNMEKLLKRMTVKCIVEVLDVSFRCELANSSAFRAVCTQVKITMESAGREVDGMPLMLSHVWDRSFSLEVLLETAWIRLSKIALPDSYNKKHHYWNNVLFLGVILVKCAKQLRQDLRVQGMMDNVQVEWCPALASLILYIASCLKSALVVEDDEVAATDSEEDRMVSQSHSALPPSSVFGRPTFTMTWTNINVFFLSEIKICFLARIDTCSLETQTRKILLLVEGAKVASIPRTAGHHPCVKSSELKQSIVALQTVRVTLKPKNRDYAIQFIDEISFVWRPSVHLSALHIAQEMAALRSQVSDLFPARTEMPLSPTPPPSFNAKVRGNLKFTIILSSRHRMAFQTSEATLRLHNETIYFQTEKLCVLFDEHNIFTFEGFVVSLVTKCDQVAVDRDTFVDLELKENQACLVTLENVSICFPHNYPFSEPFSNEFVSLTKWLRILHKKKKPEFTVDSPLPRDLFIKMKTFSIEFCDDPFEVKLRDNYELLEDEFMENQKRWKMLDAKVEELRKTHLLLPAGKVEELYANLQKKNTDIYIQRSRQMYISTPMRRSLGLWQFTDIEVLALADTSFHGKENVIKHMREIDPESPFPEEGLEFNTLWCRMIRFSCSTWTYSLRDYPCPVLDMRAIHVWGRLIGAEQEANKRAKRQVVLEIDEPWSNVTVERSMPPLKFYHDLSCEVNQMTMSYGPCWEPSIAHMNLVMDLINKPSADPSPPLPFWDRARLLFHGRLTMLVQQLAMVLRASHDPYNTTEEIDFTWTNLLLDWTNAKFVMNGDLDVYVRTASKYDDCHFLHIPGLKLTAKLDWLCLGDPNDHHSFMPCAPDKIPEYSSNQEHDSYRAFRSFNHNMSIAMETRPVHVNEDCSDIPSMLFYSSTLRWLENLKMILSSIARPIRRGAVFKCNKPRKQQLSRHIKSLRFSLSLHKFEVCYWMSFAKLRGFDLRAGKLTLSTEYNLSLIPVEDGLQHRPRADWNAAYMNCELNDAEVWLQSAAGDEPCDEMNMSFRTPVEQWYFLSVSRLSYGREAVGREYLLADTPTHRLVIYDMKGVWTKNNRDIVFSMFDSYMNNKLLRRNLSTEALKGVKVDATSTPMKSRGNSTASITPGSSSPLPSSATSSANTTPLLRQQSSPAFAMLQQLISEADNKAMVYSEDLAGSVREQQLHGVGACQTDDVWHKTWLIELINSQVLLKGSESLGYVIMSAAKAQILQRNHQPVWRECSLVSKTTWVGSLDCMQYYATVDPGELSSSMDNVMWVTVDNIEEKESMVIADLPDLVGSGQGVGGVVSKTVGGTDPRNPVQLQRIVSRCGCQFFYASYGENIDPKTLEEVPLLLPDDGDLWSKEIPVDSFTLTHHELNCCTNSLQYAMLLDIVNNLLMYVAPRKKEASEKLQRMRFQLQLSRVEDQRTPILQLQNQVR